MKNLALNTAIIALGLMPHRWGIRVDTDAGGMYTYTVDLISISDELRADLAWHRRQWPINQA